MKKSSQRQIFNWLFDVDAALSWLEMLTRDGRQEIENSIERRLAFIKTIEVIGEASRHLLRNHQIDQIASDIPWLDLVDTRNEFIHEYFHINVQMAWNFAIDVLLPLRGRIRELMQDYPPSKL